MTRALSSLLATAALAAVLGGCESAAAPPPADGDEAGLERLPSLLLGTGDTARIELPDTVAVNTAAAIVVPTAGGGCTREGDTEAAVAGLTADVRPYDIFPAPSADLVCTADFRIIRHTATLRFSQAGRATVRVHGRLRRDGPTTVVTRTLIVR